MNYFWFKGSDEMVKLLIDNGAIVNARDIDDQTPIFWAADGGNFRLNPKNENQILYEWFAVAGYARVAKILIENGAKINMRDVNSSTPLHLAVDSENGNLFNEVIFILLSVKKYVFV